MSRRSNRNRRVTRARLALEAVKIDRHTRANVANTLTAYHTDNVQPIAEDVDRLMEWVALPWWKRIFASP